MRAPLWWKQLWCGHYDVNKGVDAVTGEAWTHCNTCGRRTGAAKRPKLFRQKQPHWRKPNFPP